ncbi:MAG TPA: DUF3024 domain-containing protein [Acidobacteriota bacterium]|nr:DUF3024 domain-containing protein [Acidobacteriota bacterium]
MAFTDSELQEIQEAVSKFLDKRRPPPEIRTRLDHGYRIEGQSVELYSIRPKLLDPSQVHEEPIAKATYMRTQKAWKVFWMPGDLKWHRYEARTWVSSIQEFLSIVDEDKHGCFFG